MNIFSKKLKVAINGFRQWDSDRVELKPIVMSLDKFYDFLTDIDVSYIDAKNGSFIDNENEAFAEAVIGAMVLNNGEISIDCGTQSYDHAVEDTALESWASDTDEKYADESFEDTFNCKFI